MAELAGAGARTSHRTGVFRAAGAPAGPQPFNSARAACAGSGSTWLRLRPCATAIAERDQAVVAATPALRWPGPMLHDFGDTAALLAELDLLISVDTSVAHLA